MASYVLMFNQASFTLPVPPTHLSVPKKREQAEGPPCS